eukprot:CAMPEP_0185198688 /NCGR_PEP_ID=MMETSP1140-20130426/43473_1 /TAXON_ID=298111 /ORGANISM="Pavlova sp., Strain CCMP459" /LENGTH=405 /DNA_ID=CAMNT_0027765907 /DNA_START=1 /DNA_END=1214 /DNA_ORIENTATION=+
MALHGGGGVPVPSSSAPDKEIKAKMVKQYMMGEMLGEGSYGKVREAIDANTLRRVAVKIVDKRRLRRVRYAEEQQKREIAVQRRLKHKGITQLIEVINLEEKPDKMYIVLELITGGSLQDLLESYAKPDGSAAGLPLPLCHRFLIQLLEALAHMHDKGVIHRDIKPANLMITADGQVKISDFGCAEALDQYEAQDNLTRSSGSPAFHSPEVASGKTTVSGYMVDVWATGITLFLLATGDVPFSGSSLIHLYETISRGEYQEPPVLRENPLLSDLIRKLLAVDPEERLTLAAALLHEWVRNPPPSWAAEMAAAVREISGRCREAKSTVLPYIRKKLEDEDADAGAGEGTVDGTSGASLAGPSAGTGPASSAPSVLRGGSGASSLFDQAGATIASRLEHAGSWMLHA